MQVVETKKCNTDCRAEESISVESKKSSFLKTVSCSSWEWRGHFCEIGYVLKHWAALSLTLCRFWLRPKVNAFWGGCVSCEHCENDAHQQNALLFRITKWLFANILPHSFDHTKKKSVEFYSPKWCVTLALFLRADIAAGWRQRHP